MIIIQYVDFRVRQHVMVLLIIEKDDFLIFQLEYKVGFDWRSADVGSDRY